MNFHDLLIKILTEYRERFGKNIPKTKLLKLAYLVEVFYYRKIRRKLLNLSWIYLLYGPWTAEYDKELNTYPFILENVQFSEDKEACLIGLESDFIDNIKSDFDTNRVIHKVLTEFGNKNLRDILNFVYFETEPMLSVEKRGEQLDFSTILSDENYKVKPLSVGKNFKSKMRKKYRDKLKNVRKL